MKFEKIIEWDKNYFMKINQYNNQFLTIIFKIISFFGRESFWLFLIATFIFIYYWRLPFISIGLCLLYGLGICYIVKIIIDRNRPYQNNLIKDRVKRRENVGSSSSFPSWHTYNITAQILIFYFIFQDSLILLIGIPFTILLGISRIYLGVHYPTDVIFGFIFGVIGYFITISTFNWWYFLVLAVEEWAGFGGQPDQIINSFFKFPWYTILVVIIFAFIIISSIFKLIKRSN